MNVVCQIAPEHRKVYIYRDSNLIGFAKEAPKEDEPILVLLCGLDGVAILSFNDLAIIQDNWNAMMEQLNETSTVPV